jgi:Trypsin/FG-GAP-like repeat
MKRGTKAAIGLASMTFVLVTGASPAQAVIGGAEDLAFAAQVQVGGELGSGCTGALVAPQWVITAKSCFGAEVPAGAPQQATTVTVGRPDRTTTAGHVLRVTRLVPHPDRDVVLARLVQTAKGVPAVRIATSAPAAGDELRVLGFGRTKDEWVPSRLHGADVTVDAVGAATVSATPAEGDDAVLCKGDAGGPAVRTVSGVAELAGVHSESGQKGCHDFDGGTATTVETRVDDLAGWIAATTRPKCNAAGGWVDAPGVGGPFPDFTGDCVADLIGNRTDGTLRGWQGTGDTSGAVAAYPGGHKTVGSGWTSAGVPRVVVGDFTGDNRSDACRVMSTGELRCWASSGTMADAALFPGAHAEVGRGWTTARVPRIVVGDFNGDGRTDIAAVYNGGELRAWPSTGVMQTDQMFLGQGSVHMTIGLTVAAYPRLFTMDIDGDGDSDLVGQNSAGKLMLFRSSGDLSAAETLFNTPPVEIGSGWTTANIPRILTGDYNGDEKDDITAVYSTGATRTWLTVDSATRPFPGGGLNANPGFTVAAWPRLRVGDQDNDGLDDIFADKADGSMMLLRSSGDGSGTGDTLFPGTPRLVGSGWTTAAYLRVF